MIEKWFETPIYFDQISGSRLDDVQNEIEPCFQDLKDKQKFFYLGTSPHLLTDTKKHIIEEYSLTNLKKEIERNVNLYLDEIEYFKHRNFRIKSSWMMICYKGQNAHIHTHYHSDISGCYYFKAVTSNGDLFFESPNKLFPASYCFSHLPSRARYSPEIGKMFLFPGWLEHGVATNNTECERVSLSFDVDFIR
jgi:uncharacterized protein (TIGR02466 family)